MMQPEPPEPKVGDIFLLFRHFPYSYFMSMSLPLPLGPRVYLDYPPDSLLRRADPPAIADFLLPGYHLPEFIAPSACLRYAASEGKPDTLDPMTHLFLAVSALRLRTPLGMEIAGYFEVGEPDQEEILNPQKSLSMVSAWNLPGGSYDETDIESSSQIVRRRLEIETFAPSQFKSAWVLFSQATYGFSRSFQMTYLALFAALDALFFPKGNKAATIGRRVSAFLAGFDFPDSLQAWLEREYRVGRNDLAHGIQDISLEVPRRPEKIRAVARLHEVIRLAILGFLSLPDEQLRVFAQARGNQLQSELDRLSPASGEFIEGQRMWCD